MTYRAPVADIAFALKNAAGFGPALAEGLYGDLSEDVVDAVLEEAGKFAGDILAPLNAPGDRHGALFEDGAVTTAPGWKDAYRAWAQAGWNGLAAPAQWGGQELPHAVNAACVEMWNSAAMAFGLGPLLTMAGIDALAAHGSDELKRVYLPKLVSGEWMGTMQLTEPQAGSDVGALRTRAERAADGSYRITGQKIFITYGEHDLTDNIIHLVLARLPDAPRGGVPKWPYRARLEIELGVMSPHVGSNPTPSAISSPRSVAERAFSGPGRGARAAEGARLEIVYTSKRRIEGSNPSLSAMPWARCRAGQRMIERGRARRGGSGALYSQSAPARRNPRPRCRRVELSPGTR